MHHLVPTDALPHPDARRLPLVEELHGHAVADPYRWLEDAESPETSRWLNSRARKDGRAWAQQWGGRSGERQDSPLT